MTTSADCLATCCHVTRTSGAAANFAFHVLQLGRRRGSFRAAVTAGMALPGGTPTADTVRPETQADPMYFGSLAYHLLVDSLQWVVYTAAKTLKLEGVVTPHCLRHAYATHSREQIDALRQLLGHSSIETTAGYRHPIIEKATNPLDDLVG